MGCPCLVGLRRVGELVGLRLDGEAHRHARAGTDAHHRQLVGQGAHDREPTAARTGRRGRGRARVDPRLLDAGALVGDDQGRPVAPHDDLDLDGAALGRRAVFDGVGDRLARRQQQAAGIYSGLQGSRSSTGARAHRTKVSERRVAGTRKADSMASLVIYSEIRRRTLVILSAGANRKKGLGCNESGASPLDLRLARSRQRMRSFVSDAQVAPQFAASYVAGPEDVHRVVLLYSGGLDTSVMLKWIQDEYGAEVIALCVDLGQPADDFEAVLDKARNLGALEAILVDAKDEFARGYVGPSILANARYQGGYPPFTSLGRPLLAKLAVEAARAFNADTIAHGCTGKGNDQVRIEATVATLAPEIKVIAPVREWQMGRDEEIAYAQLHGIPVSSSVERPYWIDDNLWGRSSEGGVIEDLDQAPPDDLFELVTPPTAAPDRVEEVVIGFREGLPVSIDGAEVAGLVALIQRVAEIACRNGVGIVDHIEDRVVGLKVRDIYEVPAAEVLLTRHRELDEVRLRRAPEHAQAPARRLWARLVYEDSGTGRYLSRSCSTRSCAT